jgi:hypothetical protein
MAELMCPSLHRLGMLLHAAHWLRNSCLADKKDIKGLDKAELDLRRINDLITHYRSFCRRCGLNAALEGIPPSYRVSDSNVVSIDRVH